MNKKIIALLILVSWLSVACHPTRYIQTILGNDLTRGQIYHEILKNNLYRDQLLDSIRNNKNTRMLLNTAQDENKTLIDPFTNRSRRAGKKLKN